MVVGLTPNSLIVCKSDSRSTETLADQQALFNTSIFSLGTPLLTIASCIQSIVSLSSCTLTTLSKTAVTRLSYESYRIHGITISMCVAISAVSLHWRLSLAQSHAPWEPHLSFVSICHSYRYIDIVFCESGLGTSLFYTSYIISSVYNLTCSTEKKFDRT